MSDDITTAAPAPSPAAAPAAAPVAAAPTSAPAAAPAPAPVLASGAPAAASPAAAPAPAGAVDPHAWIPEKHRTFGEDGKTLDLDASARKVAEAYGHLEKRLGSGDAPPAAVGDYKVNIPEDLKDIIPADELSKTDSFKAFLGELHAAGASQKIVDVAVSTMLHRGLAMREAMPVLQAAECEADLRKGDGWKTDYEYRQSMQRAFQAGKQYGGADFDGILKDHGNDPRIVRLLAAVGAELEEDRAASPEAQTQMQDTLDSLQANPAYLNDRDPQHAAIVAKVTALTARMVGTKPVGTGRSMSFKTG